VIVKIVATEPKKMVNDETTNNVDIKPGQKINARFLIAYIAAYGIILGMPFVQKGRVSLWI
jgi:hypothetical protein